MKYIFGLLCVLMLVHPTGATEKPKAHIVTSVDQECSECHADQATVWFASKHGLMGVKCVVCHGSTDNTFLRQPGLPQCRGCHGEEVEQVRRKVQPAEKTCFPCHDHHSLSVKVLPKAPFHANGGK